MLVCFTDMTRQSRKDEENTSDFLLVFIVGKTEAVKTTINNFRKFACQFYLLRDSLIQIMNFPRNLNTNTAVYSSQCFVNNNHFNIIKAYRIFVLKDKESTRIETSAEWKWQIYDPIFGK